MSRTLFISLALSLFGCHGEFSVSGAPDGSALDAGPGGDTRPTPDASGDTPPADNDMLPDFRMTDVVRPDEGPDDLCIGVTCGANAACDQGACSCLPGFKGDANAGCVPGDPCGDVDCPFGATCTAGQCPCDWGYSDDGVGGCLADIPPLPEDRTLDETCQTWKSEYGRRASAAWQLEPVDQCDWGVTHPEAQKDALRRASVYRWLLGLTALTSDKTYVRDTQACATTLAAQNQGLTHEIPDSYACYTPEAAAGAGSSNIARGVRNMADTVDLYINDDRVDSLGHRRWIFNPAMGATGFGLRDAYSCMKSFDRSASLIPSFVAYPSGFFPRNALLGKWSFGSAAYRFDANSTVSITEVASGNAVTVTNVYIPGGGYGQPTLAWEVPGAAVDVEYEVRISGLSGAGDEVVYRTTLVNCP